MSHIEVLPSLVYISCRSCLHAWWEHDGQPVSFAQASAEANRRLGGRRPSR
ncbi:MAG: hypothetical protein M0Z42_12465 [Actinomycetota bacterium]|nr:hypothetical protein [Actinomycetota bacterium]